jgi:hypothetical protein
MSSADPPRTLIIVRVRHHDIFVIRNFAHAKMFQLRYSSLTHYALR